MIERKNKTYVLILWEILLGFELCSGSIFRARGVQFVAGDVVAGNLSVCGRVGVRGEEYFDRLFTVTEVIPAGCLGAAGVEGPLSSIISFHVDD